MTKEPTYWYGSLPDKDDFGVPYQNIMIDDNIMIDSVIIRGYWSETSWQIFGTGNGQKYEKQPDGRWLKIEG
jgi:hypothetical protein